MCAMLSSKLQFGRKCLATINNYNNTVVRAKRLQSTEFVMTATAEKLKGKVAVVTASTDGIGFAIAKRLAEDGACVMISSRKQKKVEEAVKSLLSKDLKVKGMVCNVSNPAQREELIKNTIDEYGGIDILVNNAACNPHFGHMLDISESAWDKLFETNVKAGFMLCKAVVPHMRKRGGGSILFVSSNAGYTAFDAIAPYGVTKTALFGLTKALSVSLADDNIRVNAIAPGVIKTKFAAELTKVDPELVGIPLKRFGRPEECSGVVSFLVSDDASYVTGETLPITGGMHSHL